MLLYQNLYLFPFTTYCPHEPTVRILNGISSPLDLVDHCPVDDVPTLVGHSHGKAMSGI
jgi:hypothetical protein